LPFIVQTLTILPDPPSCF